MDYERVEGEEMDVGRGGEGARTAASGRIGCEGEETAAAEGKCCII